MKNVLQWKCSGQLKGLKFFHLNKTKKFQILNCLNLGGFVFSIYAYGIFLANALHDYQDEKPNHEKAAIDTQFKDLMKTTLIFLYFLGFIQFISIFCPPLNFDIVYPISYFFVILAGFLAASYIVFLHIQLQYIFYLDSIKDISVASIRIKSLAWKILITIVSVSLDILFPYDEPFEAITFHLLTNGRQYERYVAILLFHIHTW